MDDEDNNSISADDSALSGSDLAASGSNGGNDPLSEQNIPQDQPTTPASEPAPEDNSEQTPAQEQTQESTQTQTPESEIVSEPAQVSASAPGSFIKNLLAEAGKKIQFNKNKKLDKIMELVRRKGSVDNADVEKLLRVSDSTASRYLNQLIKENKLKRIGSAEKPKYEPV